MTPEDESILVQCRQNAARLAARLEQRQVELNEYVSKHSDESIATGQAALANALAAVNRILSRLEPGNDGRMPPDLS